MLSFSSEESLNVLRTYSWVVLEEERSFHLKGELGNSWGSPGFEGFLETNPLLMRSSNLTQLSSPWKKEPDGAISVQGHILKYFFIYIFMLSNSVGNIEGAGRIPPQPNPFIQLSLITIVNYIVSRKPHLLALHSSLWWLLCHIHPISLIDILCMSLADIHFWSPPEDPVFQTSGSAISDSLITSSLQNKTRLLFLLTPICDPPGFFHPAHRPSLRCPWRSWLGQSLPGTLPQPPKYCS